MATANDTGSRAFRLSGNNVVVDRFEVRASIHDETLTLSLDTDAGDEARVYVEVSRSYRPPGHHVPYPVSYFNETSTVGEWRRSRVLRLDSVLWRMELESRRASLAVLERPISEPAISDDVVVRFTLPPYQPPPFTAGNANLKGKAVEVEQDARFVSRSVAIRHPLDDRPHPVDR